MAFSFQADWEYSTVSGGGRTLITALFIGVWEGERRTLATALVSWVVGEVFGMGGMSWSIVSFQLDFIFSREVSLFKPWVAVKRTR